MRIAQLASAATLAVVISMSPAARAQVPPPPPPPGYVPPPPGVTGVKVVSMHHDVSTKTGEEVVLFTLSAAPFFREARKK